MSYLRGPLTREQIATRMADRRAAPAAAAAPAPAAAPASGAEAAAAAAARVPDDAVTVPPPVADGVPVRWLDPAAPWAAQVGAVPGGTRLAPALVTRVALLYDDDKLDLRETEEWEAVLFPLESTVDPAAAVAVDRDDRDLRTEPPAGACYALNDAPLGRAAYFAGAEKAIVAAGVPARWPGTSAGPSPGTAAPARPRRASARPRTASRTARRPSTTSRPTWP